MAPQPLYQGKRIRRRRRRPSSRCSCGQAPEAQTASAAAGTSLPQHSPGWEPAQVLEAAHWQKTRTISLGKNPWDDAHMKLSTLILSLISCALAAGLIGVHYTKSSQLRASRAENVQLSQKWDDMQARLAEAGKLAEVLQFDLAARNATIETLSNSLSKLEQDLTANAASLTVAKADVAARDTQIAKLDAQVAKLEGERDDLSRRMEDLNTSISGLEKRIADTQQKLDTAQGDRTYLLAE